MLPGQPLVSIRRGEISGTPIGSMNYCLHSSKITRADCYVTTVFEDQVIKPEKGEFKGSIVSKDGQYRLWSPTIGFTEAGLEFSKGCRERLITGEGYK